MNINQGISSQYITKNKVTVTILDMISPADFVVKESPDLSNASSEANNFLEAEEAMQKYYASIEPGFFQLPLKDAIIVVLHEEKFYRAKVNRILSLSAGHLFKVFLIDYGTEISVPRERIYEIERDFLIHPFQAVHLKLLGLEPISLIMNSVDLTMSYGPVSDWDRSAAIYIKDLQKSMCGAYIEIQGLDDLHIYGRLYFCFEGSPTKCINDELVSNSFARFNEDCWKHIKTIDSILEGSASNSDTNLVQPLASKKADPEKISGVTNISDTDSDFENFKMMFINPVDGKVVAEYTLREDVRESSPIDEEESQLQIEETPVKEVLPNLCNSKNKSPFSSEERSPEVEAELFKQRHLQKLINKKKSKSPIQVSSSNTCNRNKTEQIPATDIPYENPHTSLSPGEVSSQKSADSHKIISSSVTEDRSDLGYSTADEIDAVEQDTKRNKDVHQNQIPIKSSTENFSSPISKCESNVSKDVASKIDEKPENEKMTQNQLMAQKRLEKLQQKLLKKKLHSPNNTNNVDRDVTETSPSASGRNTANDLGKASNLTDTQEAKDSSEIYSSPHKTELSNEHLEDNFSKQSPIQSESSIEINEDSSKNMLKEENKSQTPLSEHEKYLQRLQNKVRLKKMKNSTQVPEKSSSSSNQEASVDKCDSSLCDSDSGINSFSSSSNSSDKEDK